MPLLFCLAVHNALAEIQKHLRPGRHMCAPWMTLTWSHFRTGLAPSSIWPPRSWVRGPASSCTRAKPECGTGRASFLRTWSSWAMTSGTQPESGPAVGKRDFAQAVWATRVEEEDKLWRGHCAACFWSGFCHEGRRPRCVLGASVTGSTQHVLDERMSSCLSRCRCLTDADADFFFGHLELPTFNVV